MTTDFTRRQLMMWTSAAIGVAWMQGRPGSAHALRPTATATANGPAVKTRSTFYTPEKVAAARANVTELAWAAQLLEDEAAIAARAIDAGAPALWDSVTTQGLPRSIAVNQDLGSPVTGTDIFEYGNYPWLADPFDRPWKIEDPSSGYVFPTNDFEAFYASALDAHGNFDADLGDPQYLVNTAYPERGPDWGVDDGWGWIDGDGNKWTFAAYYNHWFCWHTAAPVGGQQLTSIRRSLGALRDAYLYTGDVQYAHHGIVLLDRFAQVYPDMDIAPYRRDEGYLHSDGGRGQGKAIGSIWECGMVSELVLCYDAFYPAIADGDEAGVLEVLSAKAEQYDLAPRESVADVRANIENNLLREIYPAVRGAQIFGNFGMHQAALARAAVVLDDPDAAQEWLDFVFATGGLEQADGGWITSGGDVGRTLVDGIDRDGWYFEGAPEYNILAINNLQALADTVDGFDTYPVADVATHPKFTAMVAARPRLTMLSRYTPSIGDSGQTGAPLLLGTAAQYVQAFERYGNITDAQLAYLVNGNSTDGLRGDVFSPEAPGVADRIAAVIEESGPLALTSENLTGFGLAVHRTGTGASRRAMTTYYGTQFMHGHRNALALGYFGFGLDLMPGLGYPEFADRNARRFEWESNTVASNTVVVDATPHTPIEVGQPLGYLDSEQVQMSDVAAPEVYGQVREYRRTTVMVAIDDDRSYLVDVFRVGGGEDHVFSFHTAQGPATPDGVTLVAQDGGSYAGPDVYPPDPSAPPRAGASGFDWLGAVQRGEPDGPFSIDWDITDTYDVLDGQDVHLRMSVLGELDEVALADGIPPRNKPGNPASLRYALLRRSGSDLDSRFTSVIEPYVDEPAVAATRLLPVTGEGAQGVAAVQVALADGRTDWIVHDCAPSGEVVIDDRIRMHGSFAVVRFDDAGRVISAHGHRIETLRDRTTHLLRGRQITGTIVQRTADLQESSTMVIDLDRPVAAGADLVGQYVYVAHEGTGNAVYRIAATQVRGLRLELTVDTTFVREYLDPDDLDAGFVYDVQAGQTVRIPTDSHYNA